MVLLARPLPFSGTKPTITAKSLNATMFFGNEQNKEKTMEVLLFC